MLSIVQICLKVLELPSGREILGEYCRCCKENSPGIESKRNFFVQYAEMNRLEGLDISQLSQNLYFLSVAPPQIIHMIERDVL